MGEGGPRSFDFIIVGAGFVGTSLARALSSTGRACALVTRRAHIRQLADVSVFQRFDDLADVTTRVVVHAGGLAQPRLSFDDLDSALERSRSELASVAEFAETSAAQSILQISSGGAVYGAAIDRPPPSEASEAYPRTAYGALKLAEERELRTMTDLAVSSLRCTNLFGGLQQPDRQQGLIPVLVRCALDGLPITLFADPETRRDYLYIDDVADAIAELTRLGSLLPPVVNIGSGSTMSTAGVIDVVQEIVESPIQISLAEGLSPPDSGAVSTELLTSLIKWQPRPMTDGIRLVVREIESSG
jgi:UDP-glucose 4-epimerase